MEEGGQKWSFLWRFISKMCENYTDLKCLQDKESGNLVAYCSGGKKLNIYIEC